jgi:hypothetical protein
MAAIAPAMVPPPSKANSVMTPPTLTVPTMPISPDHQRCPHCQTHLTLAQIIGLTHGAGYQQHVWVRTADGSVALVEAGMANPTAVDKLPSPNRTSPYGW